MRRIALDHAPDHDDTSFTSTVRRFPFVTKDQARRDEDCHEAFNIKVEALSKRLVAAHAETIVIGVSGGLD